MRRRKSARQPVRWLPGYLGQLSGQRARQAIDKATKKLSDAFRGEAAINSMSDALRARWKELHDDQTNADPSLTLISRRFEEVVAQIQVMFQEGPASIERGLDVLSEGEQSLFYFALTTAVFDLERGAVAGAIEGFRADELRIPSLSVFGIEEPENHLSPYYLSRIVNQLRSVVKNDAAQAIVASHSPSVLSRVEPTEVRYCRCAAGSRTSSVVAVKLPSDAVDAAKFIRGAVLAFPELYFAQFVVLVEGDTERIVLPRLAQAKGVTLDPSFVAIVPIGGRHVRYFWKLLDDLSIPHATLLDLDLGQLGGGYGRLVAAFTELIEIGVDKKDLLETEKGDVADLKSMKGWELVQIWHSKRVGRSLGEALRLLFFSTRSRHGNARCVSRRL